MDCGGDGLIVIFFSVFYIKKVFYLYYGQQNQILDKGSAEESEPACTDNSVAATLGLKSSNRK